MGGYFSSLPSTQTEPTIGHERQPASPVTTEPGVIVSHSHDDVTRGGKVASAEEVEKLRGAVNTQLLSQQRERLATQQKSELPTGLSSPKTERRRVPPILEEDSPPFALPTLSSSLPATGLPAIPIDTIRAAKAPVMAFPPQQQMARTPSYPFPPMPVGTPKSLSLEFHKPFTTLSPTIVPSGTRVPNHNYPKDKAMSGSAAPASMATFLPPGASLPRDDPTYRNPNLYDAILTLNSEPGLDSWWTNVIQIMRDEFKADRISLAVPADTTDLENVPWGQKATFNIAEEGAYSLTCLQQEGMKQSSIGGPEDQFLGTSAESDIMRKENTRHDIAHAPLGSETSTSASDEKKEVLSKYSEVPPMAEQGPGFTGRDSITTPHSEKLSQPSAIQSVRLLSELPEPLVTSEQTYFPGCCDIPRDHESRGRVLSVLQPLDFEAEPLIESSGIIKVLERGKVVVLSREYTEPAGPTEKAELDLESHRPSSKPRWTPTTVGQPDTTKPGKPPSHSGEIRPRSFSLLNSRGPRHSRSGSRSHGNDGSKSYAGVSARGDESAVPPIPTTTYNEYEQSPNSPWSQSPAPSPAIRPDPMENPFFADAKVDEESFNPAGAPPDYSAHQQVEAIGVDKASTVIHIPLIHPLLSKAYQRLRSSPGLEADEDTSNGNGPPRPFTDVRDRSGSGNGRDKRTPIALLSILSPVIPYPSNLVNSLTYLAPHLATSFSLSRHYTNIEAEAVGLQRRRHGLSSGARAVSGDGHQTDKLPCLEELVPTDVEEGYPLSVNGSVTSPSEYSVPKSSPGGSLVGTPGWDPVGLSSSNDVRSAVGTPGGYTGPEATDSYFPPRRKGISRNNSGAIPTIGGVASSQYRQPSQSPTTDRRQAEGLDPTPHLGGEGGSSTGGSTKTKKGEYPTPGVLF
jgi:hypothetical protein